MGLLTSGAVFFRVAGSIGCVLKSPRIKLKKEARVRIRTFLIWPYLSAFHFWVFARMRLPHKLPGGIRCTTIGITTRES
jgi:hypothetical protein